MLQAEKIELDFLPLTGGKTGDALLDFKNAHETQDVRSSPRVKGRFRVA
jgi:hypothetical protein